MCACLYWHQINLFFFFYCRRRLQLATQPETVQNVAYQHVPEEIYDEVEDGTGGNPRIVLGPRPQHPLHPQANQ